MKKGTSIPHYVVMRGYMIVKIFAPSSADSTKWIIRLDYLQSDGNTHKGLEFWNAHSSEDALKLGINVIESVMLSDSLTTTMYTGP